MRQTLHIFRKDVRSLSIQIGTVLLLFIGHAVFEARSWPVYNRETMLNNSLANLLSVLLPLGIFFLIALLVFEEALPGDKKDCLTRPYHRWNLLAAKVLFIVVFFNILFFLSDCYILGSQGFTVAGVLPHLLLRQVIFAIAYILPSLAIASLTATLAQFFLAWFCVLLGLIAELIMVASLNHSSGAIMVSLPIGTRFLITVAVLSAAIAIWQYGWRQTGKARIAAACLVFAYFPFFYGFSALTRKPFAEISATPFNAKGIHIAYESGPTPAIPRESNPQSRSIAILFPLRAQGIAPGTLLRGHGWAVIRAGGAQWPTPRTRFFAFVEKIENQYWQKVTLPNADFERVKQQPVGIQTSWNFEIVSDITTQIIHPDTRPFFMKDAGLCLISTDPLEQPVLACKAGLDAETEATVRIHPGPGSADIQVRPSVWGLSPVSNVFSLSAPGPDIVSVDVISRRKLAALPQKMSLSNVHLADYAAPRSFSRSATPKASVPAHPAARAQATAGKQREPRKLR